MNQALSPSLPALVVLLLDVDQPIRLADIEHLLAPSRNSLQVLSLRDYGAPEVRRSGLQKSPVDWNALAGAVVRMVADAKTRINQSPTPMALTAYYIAGRAPLPIFCLLAHELSAWVHQVTTLNQRKDGSWAVLSLGGPAQSGPEAFFDKVSALPSADEPSEASGRVGLYLSCLHPLQATGREAIHQMIRDRGENVAALLEIRTKDAVDLNENNYAAAERQLGDIMSRIRAAYPRASGYALFIAGPAHLAIMAGRAFNATIYNDIWIANYDSGHYELAFSLPWQGGRVRALSQSADDQVGRREVLKLIQEGWDEFKNIFKEEDLPPQGSFPMDAEHRKRFLDVYKKLKPLRELDGKIDEPFQLAWLSDSFSVSPYLLEALHQRHLKPEEIKIFGQTFILHELFHIDQNLRSAHYHGIGRAGFALEEVDYWADAFALGVLASMTIRDLGKKGERECARIVSALTDNVLEGIGAFDRYEHGSRIETLQERRLRRYLFWHLQHARAQTLTSPADLWVLFGKRLIVELAPLDGSLTGSGDKVVVRGDRDRTEIFIVLEGRLMRESKTASLVPADLVEMIRSYDKEAIQRSMATVLEKHDRLLAPWKAG